MEYLFPSFYFQPICVLNLKWVSCRHHMVGLHVLKKSILLVSAFWLVFNLHTFNIIVDKVGFTPATLLFSFSYFFKINLFLLIYFWLRWVFIAARGFSLVVVSGGYSSLRCAGFPLRWLLLLWNTGSRHMGFSSCGAWASLVVAHGLSCSAACGIFPDQGSNLCPLHWQADS